MAASDLGLLAAALLLLTLGAELLVRGSIDLARRWGLSSFVIGLTIVGFGTSMPELVTSVAAATADRGDIAVGNVIGSNIFNLAVILGLAALICPIPIRLAAVRREVWFVIAAAAVPWIAILAGGSIGRFVGVALLLLLALQITLSIAQGRREGRELLVDLGSVGAPVATRGHGIWLPTLLIGAGLGLLVAGAGLLVDTATSIARDLGVSELAIGLTIVAAGTSTPELVTSVVAALRKQPEIAVGNVLGSNIFNMFGILGVTATIRPQTVPEQVLLLDTPLMLALSIALLPIVGSHARISRAEGAILFIAYLAYLLVLFRFAPAWFAV